MARKSCKNQKRVLEKFKKQNSNLKKFKNNYCRKRTDIKKLLTEKKTTKRNFESIGAGSRRFQTVFGNKRNLRNNL